MQDVEVVAPRPQRQLEGDPRLWATEPQPAQPRWRTDFGRPRNAAIQVRRHVDLCVPRQRVRDAEHVRLVASSLMADDMGVQPDADRFVHVGHRGMMA